MLGGGAVSRAVHTQGVVRINITISAETKARIDRFHCEHADLRLNVSALCERAINQRLMWLESGEG